MQCAQRPLTFAISLILLLPHIALAQLSDTSAVYLALKSADSTFFEVGYNSIDSNVVREMTTEDFVMYHDQAGVISPQDAFVEIMQALEDLPYTSRRKLKEGSLEVFPLYDRGELYGAVQHAESDFYAKKEGEEEKLRSRSKSTILWIYQEEKWLMSKVLSYDHQNMAR